MPEQPFRRPDGGRQKKVGAPSEGTPTGISIGGVGFPPECGVTKRATKRGVIPLRGRHLHQAATVYTHWITSFRALPNDRRDPPRPAPRTAQVRQNRRDLRRDAIGGKAMQDALGRKEKFHRFLQTTRGPSIIAAGRRSSPNPFGPPPARTFMGQRGAHSRIMHRRRFRSPGEARCWGAGLRAATKGRSACRSKKT